MAETMG